MSTFVVARNRDAWGIIRGYVYQVDLTIERWLELQPNRSLQLECGEDIDLISRAHHSDENERQRLLEQVKYRSASITLRSAEGIEAIANAVEHRVINADIDILFRFTTNARAGIERLSPMPGVAAINVWEQVRRGELQQPDVGPTLRSILALLRDRVERNEKPDKLQANTWNRFKAFVGNVNDEQLLRLIENFEWSTGGPHSGDMAPRLQSLLITNYNLHDEHEAKDLYYRLFLFVFKRLCLPGRKILTTSERDNQGRFDETENIVRLACSYPV